MPIKDNNIFMHLRIYLTTVGIRCKSGKEGQAIRQLSASRAFTLIELSIVLIIIGLIVGGILVGRDLVAAAVVRAQITQIEKYQQAVNTFRGKYGYLPGDIVDPNASNQGLQPRGLYAGEGDGNGIIEGVTSNGAAHNSGIVAFYGETALFWRDLSDARLIDAGFSAANITSTPPPFTSDAITRQYVPEAKLGSGKYIYVWSGGPLYPVSDGKNYFGISPVVRYSSYRPVASESGSSMTVAQAYAIDKKMDDGLPQSGSVTATEDNTYSESAGGPTQYYPHFWANGDRTIGGDADPGGGPVVAGDGVSTAGTATTCYDNGSTAGGTEKYSVTQNNGAGLNCGLSFQFQ